MTITAPFKRSIKRHILFKVTIIIILFKVMIIIMIMMLLTMMNVLKRNIGRGTISFISQGANVKICINGTIPNSVQEPVAGQGLKNSAHGQVRMEIHEGNYDESESSIGK